MVAIVATVGMVVFDHLFVAVLGRRRQSTGLI